MSTSLIMYFLIGSIVICALIFIAYFILMKKANKEESKVIRQLRVANSSNQFSSEVIYLKLYMIYLKIPGLKRYLLKIRRRLEIINIEDEYKTRKQASSALTKAILAAIPLTAIIIMQTQIRNNTFLFINSFLSSIV